MHQTLSTALEPICAVINRNPFEALASLSANIVEDLRASRQHWPQLLIELATLICCTDYLCAQRGRWQLRARIVDAESACPIRGQHNGHIWIRTQYVVQYRQVLKQLDVSRRTANDAASGYIRVTPVQSTPSMSRKRIRRVIVSDRCDGISPAGENSAASGSRHPSLGPDERIEETSRLVVATQCPRFHQCLCTR